MSRPVTFFVVDHVPRFTRIGGYDVGRAAGDPLRLVGKARPWQDGDHALAVAARTFPVGDEIAADLDRRDDDMIAPFAPDMGRRTAIPVIPDDVLGWPRTAAPALAAAPLDVVDAFAIAAISAIDPRPAVAAAARVAAAIPVSISMVDASTLADPACVVTSVHAPAARIEDHRSLAPALQESLDWIAIRTAAAGELARLHAETVSTGQPVLGGLSASDLERLRALVDAWQPGQRPGRGGR